MKPSLIFAMLAASLPLHAAEAVPAAVTVEIKAETVVRGVAPEAFGINFTQDHINNFSEASKLLWTQIGTRFYRWPGGSDADTYDFTVEPDGNHVSTADFAHLVESQGGQAYVTLNYGSGSPAMAAAFVAYLEAEPGDATVLGHGWRPSNGGKLRKEFNWMTAGYWASLRASAPLKVDDGMNHLRVLHPQPWKIHDFEIGNEVMAAWENDARPEGKRQDPADYAAFCRDSSLLIKRIDPQAQIGIVIIASDTVNWRDKNSIPYEPVSNPVTAEKVSGWNPEVFANMVKLGYAPDFAIDHFYPVPEGQENDETLLAEVAPPSQMSDYNGALSWAGRAAYYRRSLNQFFGEKVGSKIYITNTEHNSCSSNPGKQSSSLVNGLFYADSFGAILQTEIRGFCWWQARSSATNGTILKSLFGWRPYGDYGLLGDDGYADDTTGQRKGRSAYTPYPTFFAARLASLFAAEGDKIVKASSSQPLLSAYACRKSNGHLAILVVNKSPDKDLHANLSIDGYAPSGKAVAWSYGKPQDEAQSRAENVDLKREELQSLGRTFGRDFPAYSMCVIDLEN